MEHRIYSFPKSLMLKKNKDFQRVYRKGTSYGSHLMVLIARRCKKSPQVGFVCGKKVGNAVVRNLARRRMKESFRLLQARGFSGYEIVFIARAPMAEAKWADICKTMEKLLSKAGILQYND